MLEIIGAALLIVCATYVLCSIADARSEAALYRARGFYVKRDLRRDAVKKLAGRAAVIVTLVTFVLCGVLIAS